MWFNHERYVPCLTSGSTGAPKEILLSKKDMRLSAAATNRFFGLDGTSVYLCPMDYRYIGARMMAVRAYESGGRLISPAPSNRVVVPVEVDLAAVVPSQVDSIAGSAENRSRVRNLIVGGAPLDPRRRSLLRESGVNAYATYGMTETSSHVALARITENVFTALPDITFTVDSRNCLVIDMPGRECDKVVTNDIVRLVSDREFEWLGRIDNVINSGGVKLHPETIEAEIRDILTNHGVEYSNLAVVGRKSEKWGEEAVLLVEGGKANGFDAIFGLLSENLSKKIYLPKDILAVGSLPRLQNGKIDRVGLKVLAV